MLDKLKRNFSKACIVQGVCPRTETFLRMQFSSEVDRPYRLRVNLNGEQQHLWLQLGTSDLTSVYNVNNSEFVKYLRETATYREVVNVDIGAGVGALSLVMSRIMKKSYVVAVESDVRRYDLLLRNTKDEESIYATSSHFIDCDSCRVRRVVKGDGYDCVCMQDISTFKEGVPIEYVCMSVSTLFLQPGLEIIKNVKDCGAKYLYLYSSNSIQVKDLRDSIIDRVKGEYRISTPTEILVEFTY